MDMITEDYVSFETAKLLKEKGFDEATNRYYNAQYDEIRTVSDTFLFHWNDEEFTKRALLEGALAIPTLQMAMKWLREKHNLALSIDYSGAWSYSIHRTNVSSRGFFSEDFNTYEEACEDGIKCCLKTINIK